MNTENRNKGAGGGKSGRAQGVGPGGMCVCPSCATRIPHKRGVPCMEETCPKCGAKMTREL